MATTTPNYGWTVPTSTDLVKDGATAIETLGDAIDASMNTALGTKKAGMVLLSSVAFSAVASQSFNDVFSATYENYKIVYDIVQSTTASTTLRLRVSGADNTTANYSSTGIRFFRGDVAITISDLSSQTSSLLVIDVPGKGAGELNIYNPFLAEPTMAFSNASTRNATPIQGMQTYSIIHNVSSSFTGFSLIASTGTISGKVSIYGINE